MLTPEMFHSLQPQLADVKSGPEPSLQFIIVKYYISHGIPKESAKIFTDQYIAEWIKQANQ